MADETRRSLGKGSGARRVGVVSCWLCGIRLHSSQMMPDGGDWCADKRWYCRDAEVCTQRWTASRRVLSADGVLLAIAPVAGLGRVVSAVPGLAIGLGYDIETALMEADDPDDSRSRHCAPGANLRGPHPRGP